MVPPSLETWEAYDKGTAKGFGAMLPALGFLQPVQGTFKSSDHCKKFHRVNSWESSPTYRRCELRCRYP